jgi:NAD(P)-dependent dehydrogenase (short-subunit alcohol dehydrogenase family)
MATSKAILVTGASSGIGAPIAARLMKDGHRVIGTCRNPSANHSIEIKMLALDVTSDISVKACGAEFLKKAGGIDVLINDAGYLQSGAIEEVTIE